MRKRKIFDIAVIVIVFIIILIGSINQFYSGITMLQGEEKYLIFLGQPTDEKLEYRECQNILTSESIAWLKMFSPIPTILLSGWLFRKQLKVVRERFKKSR